MKTIVVFAAYALVLMGITACATQPRYQWLHPSNDAAQFEKDRAQCVYEASAATGSYTPNNRGYRTGIGQAIADQIDINDRTISIAVLCMKAKGYTQQQLQN